MAGKSKYEKHDYVLRCLQKAQDADHDNREAARESFLFVNKRDGQWEPFWWSANDGKPRYTFDQVSKIIKQTVNQIKKNDFDIRVQPAGGDATKDIAQTYDGIIRNIENISSARQVYGRTAKGMVTCGFDAFRVSNRYLDSDSFDQDLLIEKINNAVDRVWFDPSSEKQDRSDAQYGFVLHAMSTEEYEDRWPSGSKESVPDDREGEAYYDKREVIVVGEFLYIKPKSTDLVMMSNGKVYADDEDFQQVRDDLAAMGVTEAKRRTKSVDVWYSRFFDNKAWLEKEKETVFDRIPIVPAYANYDVFENKSIWYGLVEKQMDSQRVLNYSMSREIEEGALAPRAKYWMTKKQAAGHEKSLATLNTNSDPVQFFNYDPTFPQIPMQQGGAQINAGLRNISVSMQQLMQDSAGQYAASVGDNPNDQSGVAIRNLQNRSDDTNYDYMESMEIAIAAAGQVCVGAIPKVYDGQRTLRLLFEDGTFEMTPVNEAIIDNQTQQIVTLNDLSQGKYDVVCSAGPAFQNRQQETLYAMMDMARIDPSVMQIGGDVMIKSVNTPAAKVLAERKRYQMLQQGMIPPDQMTEEEQQQAQAQQQNQGNDPASMMAQAEMIKAQAELAVAQTEQMKAQAALITAQARAQGVQIDAFEAETDRYEAQVKAQESGVRVQRQTIQTEGDRINNALKVKDLMTPKLN